MQAELEGSPHTLFVQMFPLVTEAKNALKQKISKDTVFVLVVEQQQHQVAYEGQHQVDPTADVGAKHLNVHVSAILVHQVFHQQFQC